MTTHLRTLSDLLWRTRWGLVVLASAWIVLATGAASSVACAASTRTASRASSRACARRPATFA
jgi:hypothetical protein